MTTSFEQGQQVLPLFLFMGGLKQNE